MKKQIMKKSILNSVHNYSILVFLILCIGSNVYAGTSATSSKTKPYFKTVKTSHSITVNKRIINYSAIAGLLPISKNIDNKKIDITEMSYIAYFKTDPEKAKRPVTFLFAGGPGASTAVINFFESGPKHFIINPINGTVSDKAGVLLDNPLTWLQFTDLVYIDAPGTGFGIINNKKYLQYLWGCESDAECFAYFINSFIKKYTLANIPFYILGESYGGMRTVLLADKLIKKYSRTPSGLLLFSPMLNYSYGSDNPDPTMTMIYAAALPSMTSAAYYHKKLPGELLNQPVEKVINESEKWAMTDYLNALNNINSLNECTKQNIEDKMVKYTGLNKVIIQQYNYKISIKTFLNELLKKENKYMGIYDSRYTLKCPPNNNLESAPDPFWAEEATLSTLPLEQYYKEKLKLKTNIEYINVNFDAEEKWIWQKSDKAEYSVQVVSILRELIKNNPKLKYFVASGYYDLCIPFTSQKFIIAHLNLPKYLSKNLIQNFYFSGHELCTDTKAAKTILKDVKAFYKSSNTNKH